MSMNPMHVSSIDSTNEREMQSPFGTAAAQAGPNSNKPSIQGLGSSHGRHQASNHPYSTSNNYSKPSETSLEASRTTPPTSKNETLLAPDSLSDLSPFAHAPPLALSHSLSASLASSAISSVCQSAQSDQKSQKSSPIGQSITSAATEAPEEAVAAAMATAAAATTGTTHNYHQRNLPVQPPSPFLEGILPAGSDDLFCHHPLECNLFPVPEGTKEGQSSSTDISTPHFPGNLPQENKQQLLQQLFPPIGSSNSTAAASTTPGGFLVGRVEPQIRTPSSSPVVYMHPSGIPRQGSSSTNSVLSSPPSPAAATAGLAAGAGAFSYSKQGGIDGGKAHSFTLGGVQLTPDQLQKAALQALQSGQSYASTQTGREKDLAPSAQAQQQSSVANKLLSYQSQQNQQYNPAVPAGLVNQPTPPLCLQDAPLQALQQQQPLNSAAPATARSSSLRRSDSWNQFRGNRSYPPSIISSGTPTDRRSLEVLPSFLSALPADLGEGLLCPAVRYSLSKDSCGGGSVFSQRTAVEQSAASLLQRVQLSTKNYPKVRALLNTGGQFINDPDNNSLTYQGGEVRLVSLPEGCSFPQLLAVLAKTQRPGLGSSTATASSTPLKSSSPKDVACTTSIKETSSATTGIATASATTAAQTLSAAAAAVSALIAAQEAATATSALDAESYATYAMHVARTHCLLRYQLPSDPSIFVDVADDEDVHLMFEEIAELLAFRGLFGNAGRSSGGASPKLRLFVQWIAPSPGTTALIGGVAAAAGKGGGVNTTASRSNNLNLNINSNSRNNTLDYLEGVDQFLSPMYSGSLPGVDNQTSSSGGDQGGSGTSENPTTTTGRGDEKHYSAGDNTLAIAPRNNKTTHEQHPNDSTTIASSLQQQQQQIHFAHRSASELRLAAVRSDQLEIIPASEVTLVELLGTGTFGDMYVGKWRECTVAVKALNPATIGLNYGSQEAWLAFLHDANSAAALRHPNLVEVYGIVLPGAKDQRSMQQDVHQRSESLGLALKALKAAGNGDGEGGLMIDPKMSGRRTSWDFSALTSNTRSSSTSIPGIYTTISTAPGAATTPNFGAGGVQRLPGPCMSTPAMVMEYISGRSLHGAIKRKEDAVAGVLARVLYALDVARGMAYLHHRGITHFDLKSTNVLIGWRNMRPAAKIAGYGLSTRKTSLLTYTPGVSMSPSVFPWIAPEILRKPEKVSHKVDIFSFGIILWELWALSSPYEGMDMKKIVSLAVNTDEQVRPEVPPPRSGNAEPAPGWRELVEHCWVEDPDERLEFVEIEKRLKKMAKEVKLAQRKPEAPPSVMMENSGGGGEMPKAGETEEEKRGSGDGQNRS